MKLLNILFSAVLLLGVGSCGSEETLSSLSSSDFRSLRQDAPNVAKAIGKWQKELEKLNRKGFVIENKHIERKGVEAFIGLEISPCFKLKNDQKRLMATFLDVFFSDIGRQLGPAVKAEFKSLFNKKRFGQRNVVCDLSAYDRSNKIESRRVFISGDGKYSLELRVEK